MPSKFVPLDDAAKALGMSAEAIQSLRESGGVRAFRDGASWKFPQDEIDRLIAEDALSDDSGDELFDLDVPAGDDDDAGEMNFESEVSLMAGDGGSEGELRLVSSGGESGENILGDFQSDSNQMMFGDDDGSSVDPLSVGTGDPIIVDGGDSADDLNLDLESDSNATLLGDAASGASGENMFAPASGADIAGSEDDLVIDLDSASGAAVLGGGVQSGGASASDVFIGDSRGGSEDDLAIKLDSDSGAAVLGGNLGASSDGNLAQSADMDISGSVDDLLREITPDSGSEVLGSDSASGALLADSESIGLDLQGSAQDLIADISSQSDVLSAIEVAEPATPSPISSPASPESEIPLDLLDSPADESSAAISPAGSASDGDLDLSMDLELDEPKTDVSDLDLSLDDASLSEPDEVDLAAGQGGDAADAVDSDALSGLSIDSDSDPQNSLELAEATPDEPGEAIASSGIDNLELEGDEDDDLVIESESVIDDFGLESDEDDSDLVLGGGEESPFDNSGINLMSPSDSGLALDSAPLSLSGSNLSGFDLGGDLGGSSVSDLGAGSALAGSGSGILGSSEGLLGSGSGIAGSGSVVDFQADEEFQLSPEGMGLEADDDSGSQVIDVEDSVAFGGVMDAGNEQAGWDDGAEGIDGVEEAVADSIDDIPLSTSAAASVAAVPTYETPFSIWSVMSLAGICTMLTTGGIFMSDLVRNLGTNDGEAAAVSTLTAAVLKALGLDA